VFRRAFFEHAVPRLLLKSASCRFVRTRSSLGHLVLSSMPRVLNGALFRNQAGTLQKDHFCRAGDLHNEDYARIDQVEMGLRFMANRVRRLRRLFHRSNSRPSWYRLEVSEFNCEAQEVSLWSRVSQINLIFLDCSRHVCHVSRVFFLAEGTWAIPQLPTARSGATNR
jgi:hypothetical protein